MSFSTSKEVYPTKRYQSLGNLTVESETPESVNITVTAEAVKSLVGSVCTVSYSFWVEGATIPGYDLIEFEYKGVKGPLEEAEDCLKELLGG